MSGEIFQINTQADLGAGSSQAESCSAPAAAQVETEESGLAFPAEPVLVVSVSLVRLAEREREKSSLAFTLFILSKFQHCSPELITVNSFDLIFKKEEKKFYILQSSRHLYEYYYSVSSLIRETDPRHYSYGMK